jgi:tetratricopeptide (TPR) repeat protein
MKIKVFIFSFLFSFILSASFAQYDYTEQLAVQSYQEGNYNKAVDLFKDLFHKNTSSDDYYDYYLNCLVNLKQYKDAETELKKLIKKYPSNPKYSVDLGYIYGLSGNIKKKSSINEGLLNEIYADERYISLVANSFIKREDIDDAIAVYLKGRKIFRDNRLYSFTLADLYRLKSDIPKMVEEYLKIINEDPTKLDIVQDKMQDVIQDELNYNKTKELLLKAVQGSDYSPAYVNFLTWLFVQKKDFEEAFRQQKALDKRSGTNDANLFRLGNICLDNKAYPVAGQIYQYLVDKGQQSPYYSQAKFGILDIEYYKVTNKPNPTNDEINELEKSYENYLFTNFYAYITVSEKLIIRLAEIKAIYKHNVIDAINFLQQYLNAPQINKDVKARMKIALGDYYILSGDIWEATLLYSQVDKAYQDNPIGHEAKFRNARLSFFRGDFAWASDQLEVLRGSTSELIANDAIQLGLLIQDNLGLDSTDNTLKMFARADFFIFKNEFDSANKVMDSILIKYPGHSLTDDIYFAKAEIEVKRKDYPEAVKFYEKVYTDYSQDIFADDALFKAADIYLTILNDTQKAGNLYEKLVLDYPQSVFAVEARKKYRELRGDKLSQ